MVSGVFQPLWFTGSHMPNILTKTLEPEDVTDADGDEDNIYDNDSDSENENYNDDDGGDD